MQKTLHHVHFLCDTYFSYNYKSISDFSELLSINQHVIYGSLAKGKNIQVRKVAKLLKNSSISRFLMKLKLRNFWKSDKVFVTKDDFKITKIAKTVAKLAMVLLTM